MAQREASVGADAAEAVVEDDYSWHWRLRKQAVWGFEQGTARRKRAVNKTVCESSHV